MAFKLDVDGLKSLVESDLAKKLGDETLEAKSSGKLTGNSGDIKVKGVTFSLSASSETSVGFLNSKDDFGRDGDASGVIGRKPKSKVAS